ncbi:MAG: hypothetical protein ACI4KR_09780 [Ruminiclostridium sp.]
MAEISKITLPSGTTYDLKDSTARANISALSGALKFLGTTTTAITDGAATTPITIGDTSVTPAAGNVVIYGNSEFVWSAAESKWREFGSTGSLKSLAFKDNASGSYTPAGSVSQPAFTGTKATISSSFTPAGSVAISTGTGTANYTPAGSVSAPTVSVALNTSSVTPFGSAGTLPSCTLPSMSATVSGETLTLGWSAGSFSAGTLPSAGTAVTVATSVKSATASAPTFTGTGTELKATFTGTAGTASASYTPAGTVSKPTFTGTAATITVS